MAEDCKNKTIEILNIPENRILHTTMDLLHKYKVYIKNSRNLWEYISEIFKSFLYINKIHSVASDIINNGCWYNWPLNFVWCHIIPYKWTIQVEMVNLFEKLYRHVFGIGFY